MITGPTALGVLVRFTPVHAAVPGDPMKVFSLFMRGSLNAAHLLV
jgi:hypothetical protein